MILYYENSKGAKVNLLNHPYRAFKADVFDSSWNKSNDGYKKTIDIDVFGKADLYENLNKLYSVLAVDADNDIDGKLWVNDTYIKCHVVESKKDKWKSGVVCTVSITFLAQSLSWIKEEVKAFYPYGGNSETGFDYNFDFPIDYSSPDQGNVEMNIDATAPMDFTMVVYGASINPFITVNGYPYSVYTTLEAGEYMIIDSKTQSITKVYLNGEKENIFNDRDTTQSIFKKIDSGNNVVRWDGTFGFDIILYNSRKEPIWM